MLYDLEYLIIKPSLNVVCLTNRKNYVAISVCVLPASAWGDPNLADSP